MTPMMQPDAPKQSVVAHSAIHAAMPTLTRFSYAMIILLIVAIRADGAPDCVDRETLSRFEALAAIQSLQVDLLSHDSATETLERWCKGLGQVHPANITAERLKMVDPQPTPEIRQYLRVGPEIALKFRHVRLKCGDMVLSEADNWYVPARLTPVMNKALDSSERPFGKVVKPLGFTRHTLSASLLWAALSAPRRTLVKSPSGEMAPPYFLFEHRALLQTGNGTPFSLLIERYTRNLLKPARLALN
jgi:hypothetical protein